MSVQDNKVVAGQFHQALQNAPVNPHAAYEILARDFVFHHAPPGLPANREGLKLFVEMLGSAFPDLQTQVEEVVAEGDKVVQRWTARATHQGDFLGIPATGRPVSFTGIDLFRIQDGKIAEHWPQVDQFTLFQQLGVIPVGQP